MQITKVNSEKLKHEYNIVVPANDIESRVEQRLQEIGKDLKMPGFRPGKVPADVIKKNYGKNVLGEVLEKVVETSSKEAISKEDLRPAMQPKIEIIKFEEGSDLKYKMEVEVLPDIPKIDFKKISLEKPVVKVDDKEVTDALGRIAEQQQNFKPSKTTRAAKLNDFVSIDFKGFVDGEAFDGGEAKGHQIKLGSKSFIEGFEEQVVGMKKGDKKDVNVSFPEQYHAEHLAGKPAKFEVKLNDILEAEPQKIDEEFATKLGLESLDKLKEAVKSQIESEVESACRAKLKKELFDKLDKKCDFPVPEEMLKLEFDAVWKQIEDAKKANPDSKEFKKSEKKLKEEYQEMAKRRVRLGIFLSDIGRKNDFKITNEEISEAVRKEAMLYPGQEMKIFEHYKNHPEHIENLKGPILEEKVVDFILENVTLKEKKLSLKELQESENNNSDSN